MCRVHRPPRARAAALSGETRRPGARSSPQWADSTLFWTAVPYTMQPAGAAAHLRRRAARVLKAFGADRAAMTPALRRAPPHDDAAALARLPAAGSSACSPTAAPFLLGDAPRRSPTSRRRSRSGSCAARRRSRRMLDALPRASTPGSSACAAFGHGDVRRRWRSAEAIALAAGARRSARADVGRRRRRLRRRRRRSASSPADYAHDEVAGSAGRARRATRSSSSATTSAPARVHVHFPRIGFHVKAVRKDRP